MKVIECNAKKGFILWELVKVYEQNAMTSSCFNLMTSVGIRRIMGGHLNLTSYARLVLTLIFLVRVLNPRVFSDFPIARRCRCHNSAVYFLTSTTCLCDTWCKTFVFCRFYDK